MLKCSADKVAPPTAGIRSEHYRTVPNGGDVAQKGVPRGRSPEAGRKATPTGHRRKLDDGAGYSTWTAQLTPHAAKGLRYAIVSALRAPSLKTRCSFSRRSKGGSGETNSETRALVPVDLGADVAPGRCTHERVGVIEHAEALQQSTDDRAGCSAAQGPHEVRDDPDE